MAEEEKQEEMGFDPFGSINLQDLQAMGDIIPDVLEEEEQEEIKQQLGQEEEQEEEEIIEDTGAPSSKDTENSSLYIPFAKLLIEEGTTPNLNLEEFDGTPEGLLKAVQHEIEFGINSYKETNLDPRVKWLQDNLEQNVPLEELLKMDARKVSLSQITEESLKDNAEAQKSVIKQYYQASTSFSDELINKTIERLEAVGELEEEATRSFGDLKVLTDQQEIALQQQAAQNKVLQQQQQEKALTDFKGTLAKTEEIISGIKLNDIMRDKIFKNVTTPVDIDKETGMPINKIAKARSEDPLGFEIKLNYLFELTNGFKDWAPLGASGKKTAISELEAAARKLDARGGSSQKLRKPATDENLADEMAQAAEYYKRNY